jgi:hypothetical protein
MSSKNCAPIRNPGSGAPGALFRKILVLVQFGLSILLLIGMGVVSRQVEYMTGKKLGYEKEHLVYLPLRGDTPRSYAAFKEEALKDPRIQGVTATHQPPTSISSNSWGAAWDKKDPNQRVLIGFGFVDFDFTETMKIELAAGRSRRSGRRPPHGQFPGGPSRPLQSCGRDKVRVKDRDQSRDGGRLPGDRRHRPESATRCPGPAARCLRRSLGPGPFRDDRRENFQ